MSCNIKGSALPFFLTGLGTGIALTLLLAPRSGSETRGLIGRKVRDVSRQLKDGENWMKDKAVAAKDYVETHAAGLRAGAKEVAEVIGRT